MTSDLTRRLAGADLPRYLSGQTYRYERSRLRLEVISKGRGSTTLEVILGERLGDEAQEVMLVMALDSDGRVRAVAEAARGDYHAVLVPLAPLLAVPILAGCNSFAIAHNHPSGRLQASKHDIDLTKTIVKAGNALGLTLADHLIAVPSTKGVLSMAAAGMLEVPVPVNLEVQA